MKVKKWKLASFLLPCLLLFALIYLAPMCMVFGSSFFEWKAGGVFKFIGLDNYINAFRNDARMLTALKNTGIWVVLQSVVHVMLGTVIAFMLSKRKKRLESPQNYLYDPECGICSGTGCYFPECI